MSGPKTSAKRSSGRENFVRAVANLRRSVAAPILEPRDLSGIIKDFEMAYELSWKTLKRALKDAGNETLGAKDVFTQGYRLGYLDDEGVWLRMIEDRNQTSHVYDEAEAREIVARVQADYEAAFEALLKKLGLPTP